ncbi:MAG TPA: MFS transporter [Paraburkholderia sp.]|nr:MFS transporter [Paraburkholderia sp.]
MPLSRTATPADVATRTKVRYVILALIFIITTINYADRATLSVTGSAMRTEFGLDAIRMGYIFSAFSWAYVLSQVPAGWILDRFGARRVYAASIFFWSLFTLLQSALGVLGSAAAAATAPKEAISLSGSIFNMFGNAAGIVTPIAIGYLAAKTGSFDGALAFVGVNAVVTVLSYLVIVKEIKRVELV